MQKKFVKLSREGKRVIFNESIIPIIKDVRIKCGVGLKEAKLFVDFFKDNPYSIMEISSSSEFDGIIHSVFFIVSVYPNMENDEFEEKLKDLIKLSVEIEHYDIAQRLIEILEDFK